jgi:hypothetical protein
MDWIGIMRPVKAQHVALNEHCSLTHGGFQIKEPYPKTQNTMIPTVSIPANEWSSRSNELYETKSIVLQFQPFKLARLLSK